MCRCASGPLLVCCRRPTRNLAHCAASPSTLFEPARKSGFRRTPIVDGEHHSTLAILPPIYCGARVRRWPLADVQGMADAIPIPNGERTSAVAGMHGWRNPVSGFASALKSTLSLWTSRSVGRRLRGRKPSGQTMVRCSTSFCRMTSRSRRRHNARPSAKTLQDQGADRQSRHTHIVHLPNTANCQKPCRLTGGQEILRMLFQWRGETSALATDCDLRARSCRKRFCRMGVLAV